MDLKLGEQTLVDAQIPLLWGSRAISQDRYGRLSVVDLSQGKIVIEIIGDKPVPGIPFAADDNGFEILSNGRPIYHYNPEQKTLKSIDLGLPQCQVSSGHVRIGSTVLEGNTVIGFGIGVAVTESGISIGAPLPPALEELIA